LKGRDVVHHARDSGDDVAIEERLRLVRCIDLDVMRDARIVVVERQVERPSGRHDQVLGVERDAFGGYLRRRGHLQRRRRGLGRGQRVQEVQTKRREGDRE